MEKWIDWEGGECPVADDTWVFIRLRDGTVSDSAGPARSHTLRWGHNGIGSDIIAYCIEQPADALADTLTERGEFIDNARVCQGIKQVMHASPNWAELPDDMKEALEMIAHKTARILNGDPMYADSWHDIAGYAKLVEGRLE